MEVVWRYGGSSFSRRWAFHTLMRHLRTGREKRQEEEGGARQKEGGADKTRPQEPRLLVEAKRHKEAIAVPRIDESWDEKTRLIG